MCEFSDLMRNAIPLLIGLGSFMLLSSLSFMICKKAFE
jgi:hypothetical protein